LSERQASPTPDSVLSVICLARLKNRAVAIIAPSVARVDIATATGINCACARANPTRLAPDWTFTQPPQSLATLVSFYLAVSAITS
jgi:hypothetical protein